LKLPADLANATLAGKYRVMRVIGSGDGAVEDGVARLYAEHATIQREVEVKILLEPSDAGRAKLLREARALGQVSHASMRSVLDTGTDARGRPFVVYEALPGESLASRLDRHPDGLEPEAAATIAIQILEGLRALHATGVVARDLSPDHIALVRTKSGEIAKVTSLARAAFLGERSELDAVRGSPWAAPEARSVDGAPCVQTDVYSAGRMLQHLLTGSPEPGTPISDTAERAIARATAHDPDDRFPSIDALMSAIALLLPTGERPARDRMSIPLDTLAGDLHWLGLRRRTRHATVEIEPQRVHLLMALVSIEAVYRRLGEAAWQPLVDAMPALEDVLPGAGQTAAHQHGGVDITLVAEMLARADESAGHGDLTLVSELGASIAQRSLRRLCPELPSSLTPGALVDGFPYLWSCIAKSGRGVVVDRTSGHATLAIEGMTTPLEILGLTAGLLRAALIECGGRPVSVSIAASSALGDRRDLLLARWVPRASMPPRA
jgi:serine/threonine protein kinase